MGGFLQPPGGSGAPPTAAQVSYDNTTSGLAANNVQAAIDELAQGGGFVLVTDGTVAAEVYGDVPYSLVVPANTLQTGRILALSFGVQFTSAAQNLQLQFRIGTVAWRPIFNFSVSSGQNSFQLTQQIIEQNAGLTIVNSITRGGSTSGTDGPADALMYYSVAAPDYNEVFTASGGSAIDWTAAQTIEIVIQQDGVIGPPATPLTYLVNFGSLTRI